MSHSSTIDFETDGHVVTASFDDAMVDMYPDKAVLVDDGTYEEFSSYKSDLVKYKHASVASPESTKRIGMRPRNP